MKKTAGAVLGLVATGPLLLAAPLLFASSGIASATCSSDSSQAVETAAVAAEVKSILAGSSKGTVSVPGLDDPAVQVPNAETITATGIAMDVPARGQVVALATALQESGLRNLASGDRDSLGLFQQRPSAGWGTAEQIMQPVYASTKFYQALLQVPGWQSMTVTQAAQAVQQSAYPDAYAKWQPLATTLQQAIAPLLSPGAGTAPSTSPTGAPAPASSASTSPTDTAEACSEGIDGSGFGPIPPGGVPSGYTIPASALPQVQTALRWAMGQLGTAYQWGGSCTDPHGSDPMGRCDCSSLVQQAYRAAGVTLDRTTFTQVTEGTAVSVDDLQPGDLVFTAGSDGTAASPGHVGIYMDDSLIINAPHTGAVVSIDTLASWLSQIVAVRRVV